MIIDKTLKQQDKLYKAMDRLKAIYINSQDETGFLNTQAKQVLAQLANTYILSYGVTVEYVDNDNITENLKTVKHYYDNYKVLYVRDSFIDRSTMKQCDLDLNNLARTMHDYMHLKHDLTFNASDETQVIKLLCRKLHSFGYDTVAVYHAIDFYLQVLYYRDNKEFMQDQYNQVLEMLNNVNYVNELLDFIDSFDSVYFDEN